MAGNFPNIEPLPHFYRENKIKRFVPNHPPIFPDGDPSPADIQLALDLIAELDESSQYRYRHFVDKHSVK